MQIALVPLDERPVNTKIPQAVASIAGAHLALPPKHLLPNKRQAGDIDGLTEWCEHTARKSDAMCVCLDTLLYGGLISARTSLDSTAEVFQRIDTLRRVHRMRPELPLHTVSLVMRASNSYSTSEEPLYWEDYGKELHQLGAAYHHIFEGHKNEGLVQALEETIPSRVRSDFERRRLRNHLANLEALGLLTDGVLTSLFITADDTNPYAAGTLEQQWLGHWGRALPRQGHFLMYPGADEVGAILVAKALSSHEEVPVRFRVSCSDPSGMDIVPAHENQPLRVSIERQIAAADAVIGEDADITLVVHTPHPDRLGPPNFGDTTQSSTSDERKTAQATAGLAREALERGERVALADVRYTNGADPLLVDELSTDGTALQLTSYGGWNTANNTLGSTLALGIADVIGSRHGRRDENEITLQLLHRLIEDRGWQSGARETVRRRANLKDYGEEFPSESSEAEALELATSHLRDHLESLNAHRRFSLTDVVFPWHRPFEIDFTLARVNGMQ